MGWITQGTGFAPNLAPMRVLALLCLAQLAGCGARSSLPEPEARTRDGGVEPAHDAGVDAGADPCGVPLPAQQLPLGIAKLSLARGSSCALMKDGKLRCWGASSYFKGAPLPDVLQPKELAGIADAVDVTSGPSGTPCVAATDGSVRCLSALAWQPLPDVHDAIAVEQCEKPPSGVGVCALLNGGDVVLWDPDLKKTTPVSGVHGVVELAAGSSSCGRRQDGTVVCWGHGIPGVTPIDPYNDQQPYLPPSEIPALSGAVQIAVGGFGCARYFDGSRRCWGSNWYGQLGPEPEPGPKTIALDPVLEPDQGCGKELALGADHACQRTLDGHVDCWGDVQYGQLGYLQPENLLEGNSIPTRVPDLSNVLHLAVGGGHSCAVTTTELLCWGNNESGQLGDGTTISHTTPMPVLW